MKLRTFPLYLFLFLLIIIFTFSIFRFFGKKDANKNQLVDQINIQLFEKRLFDWHGKAFQLNDVKDKVIYIHFLDYNFIPDRDFLMKVFRDWGDYRIEIIIFTTQPDLLIASCPELIDKAIIVNKDIDDVRKMLGSDKENSFCYLYDFNKKFVTRMQTSRPYEMGMNYELMKLLESRYFRPADILKGGNNLNKAIIFEDILRKIPVNKKKYLIISLMATFCDGCFEGRLVSSIKRLYDKGIAEAGVVFYDSMNNNDVENFVKIFNIKFPVIIAKNDLLNEWNSLVKQYSWTAVSTIVLLASGDGEIIDSYYKGCNCENNFENILKKIGEKEN